MPSLMPRCCQSRGNLSAIFRRSPSEMYSACWVIGMVGVAVGGVMASVTAVG